MNKHLLFIHICHFLELLGPYKEWYQQIEIEDFVDFSKVNNIHLYNNGNFPLWIQYEFKDVRIQINSYAIKSANRSARIKSWKIEISEDGKSWTQIDERNNVTELKAANRTKFIPIKMSQPLRFIRIITDQNSFDGFNEAAIGKLEFFGNIINI